MTSDQPRAYSIHFREQGRGISSVVVGIVGVTLLVGAGFLAYQQSQSLDERRQSEEVSLDHELLESQIRKAIVERRAIFGMTKYQVIQSKGHPLKKRIGPQITDAERKGGVTESWSYTVYEEEPEWVAFNVDGIVLASSDTAKARAKK